MEMIQLDKAIGQQVEFHDEIIKKNLNGILDFNIQFGLFYLRLGELDKYDLVICKKGDAKAYFVVDGKIKNRNELTKDWDRYDILTEFETDEGICTAFESDFDKGVRVTRVNIKSGEIIENRCYNCLE